ncbi:MAG: lipopolysaccharide heptosyltransferase II [Pseudomonadota bacterium]
MSRVHKPLEGAAGENLLVRLPNWVGDALLATPALHALRRTLPRSHICVLAKPWVAPLFEASPDCDEVFTYERPGRHAGIVGLWLLCRELRCRRFGAAVLFQNAFEAALISRLARIPVRAGYATDARGLLLNHAVPVNGAKSLHEADYYLRLVECLGGDCRVDRRLRLTLPEWAERAGDRRLAELGLEGVPLIGLAPGAQYGTAKRWPAERFAAVGDALVAATAGAAIIFGSRGEQDVARSVAERMRGRCFDLAGKTPLLEAAAVISRLAVFITNDSGLMHLAAALSVPLVAVFGPTDERRTSPLGRQSRLVRHSFECAPCLKRHCPTDHRCMLAITPEEVLGEALGLLEVFSPA